MFSGASNFVEGVDTAFALIFGISLFFIVVITAFMIYTVVKFSRKRNKKPRQFSGSVKLELLWTVIPLVLVVLMFYYGWVGFAPMRQVPDDAIRIKAIGKMWEWVFEYENGKTSPELVIPVNQPVRLDLVSPDVNHSLYIPAFRVKEDVVPGYDNYMWFTPYYIGEYEILCTEYCGLLHSAMTSKAKVVSVEEYDEWYADLSTQEKVVDPKGLQIIKDNGCTACHSLDGSRLVGPTFKGLGDAEKYVIVDGDEKQITVDAEYLERAIIAPNEEIVKGFDKNLMKSYDGMIPEEDIDLMIEYLLSLDEG